MTFPYWTRESHTAETNTNDTPFSPLPSNLASPGSASLQKQTQPRPQQIPEAVNEKSQGAFLVAPHSESLPQRYCCFGHHVPVPWPLSQPARGQSRHRSLLRWPQRRLCPLLPPQKEDTAISPSRCRLAPPPPHSTVPLELNGPRSPILNPSVGFWNSKEFLEVSEFNPYGHRFFSEPVHGCQPASNHWH